MKKNNLKRYFSLAIITVVMSTFLYANVNKSIYGNDNRRLIRSLDPDNSLDQIYLHYSPSILAQIPSWRITEQTKNTIAIETKTLRSGLKFCADEKFLEEPIVSSCTAFLVAPNMIMTAGHCVKDKFECKKNTWVLDYHNNDDNLYIDNKITFNKDKTFQCAELITQAENQKVDYAIIRLDRAIDDRPMLKIRKNGKTDSKEPLILFGHPLGMPLMVSDQIFIRDNSLEYVFKTNADSFSGNSGSPLIGLNSGLVEGILIKGDDDFVMNSKENCNKTVKCHDKDCRGETVLRSNYLPNKYIP
jgi:V8-like Glu-specific endopeptidase